MRLAAKVFESSLDAVFITSAGFSILAVNPQCEHLTGSSQAQLLGSDASLLFHDPHDLSFFLRVQDALAKEGSWEGQLWHRSLRPARVRGAGGLGGACATRPASCSTRWRSART